MSENERIHQLVQKAYGEVARQQEAASGCGCSCGCGPAMALPEADLGLSCGNPVETAGLRPGEVVLDLGSGAGRDVFEAARQVGAAGRVIGVDMTPDMVALARRNAAAFRARYGLDNVEFRSGQIEALPVEADSVDLVISNCVINLSPDKERVFREIFRVLKPGGRLMVSDIVLNRELPPAAKADAALYAGCVAGALLRDDYLGAIRTAGFPEVTVLKDIPYDPAGACHDPLTSPVAAELAGVAASVTLTAVKPA